MNATEANAEPEVSSQTETVTQTQPAAVAEPAPVDVVAEIVAKLEEPVATAGAAGARATEPAAVENSEWLTPNEIIKLPSFKKLTKLSAELLLSFYRTGDRLKSVQEVMGIEGEAARLACLLYDKGNLKVALDDMLGISERDRVLASIAKAVRSRKVSREKVALLQLEAKIILGVDADADAADERTATRKD